MTLVRYFFRSRPFDEARRGFYRARNEERSLAQGREKERERMENGFQQWPRVISNSTSRCNLMLVENKEKKKKGNFFSTLVVRGLAKEGKVISSSCGLSRNALLFHEFFFFLFFFQGWGERERDLPPSRWDFRRNDEDENRAYARWSDTKVVFFTRHAICLDISIKRTELPGPTVTFISSYSKASVECRLCVPLTFSFLPVPFCRSRG